jgi:hypothetical protein
MAGTDKNTVQRTIEQCQWPELPPRYDRALREAVPYCIRRFDATAIVAAGTIIRGSPDAHSDLDLYVIHRQPYMQRVQKIFRGVPAEMFVNTPGSAQRFLSAERGESCNIAAHMLATGFVVLDGDPALAALRRTARENLSRRPRALTAKERAHERYLAATLFEDADDVLSRDPATAAMYLAMAVKESLRYFLRRRRLAAPRNKDRIATVERLDPALGRLVRRFYTAGTVKQRAAIAWRIADRTVGARGFFEWDSGPVEAPVKVR